MNKRPYGVGGWLKFYINCSLYFTPVTIGLAYLLTLSILHLIPLEMAQSMTVTFVTISTIVQIALAVWCIKSCLQLQKDLTKKSVEAIKLFLIVSAVISFVVDLLLGEINFSLIEFSIYLLFLLTEPITWYWYFSTSQRVKNTYLKSLHAKKENIL